MNSWNNKWRNSQKYPFLKEFLGQSVGRLHLWQYTHTLKNTQKPAEFSQKFHEIPGEIPESLKELPVKEYLYELLKEPMENFSEETAEDISGTILENIRWEFSEDFKKKCWRNFRKKIFQE